MSSLAEVVREIADDVSKVAGLTVTYPNPPEQINEFPAALVYAESGSWSLGAQSSLDGRPAMWGVHTIRVIVFVARQDLPADVQTLMPFVDSIPGALLAGYARDRFGGSVTHLGNIDARGSNAITYTLGGQDYGQGVEALSVNLVVTIEGTIYE